MCFGSPHDNAISPLFDDADIIIGVVLLRGQQAAVAFDIGLGNRETEILLLALLEKRFYARIVLSSSMFVQMACNHI